MPGGIETFKSDYERALLAYLGDHGKEEALQAGYSCGHRAIELKLGLLNLVEIHDAAMRRVIFAPGDRDEAQALSVAGHDFLSQVLAPFEMTSRGYAQANEQLQELTKELQQRVLELSESEERFRQIAESISEVFWMTDLGKDEMLYISPGYEKIWGRTRESLYEVPSSWSDAIHPDDRARVRAAAANQSRGGYDEIYRIVRSGGEIRWIRDRAFPVKNSSGDVFRVTGIAEDITERRELEETRTSLASILEATTDFVGIATADGHPFYINPAGRKMLGIGKDEDVSTSVIEDYCPPSARNRLAAEIIPHAIAHGTWSGELALLTRDGREIPISCITIVHKTSGGEVRFISTISRDITKSKEAEERLRLQYALVSILVESTTLDQACHRILQSVCELVEWKFGAVWLVDDKGELLRCTSCWAVSSLPAAEFEAITRRLTLPPKIDLPGRAWSSAKPIWIPDVMESRDFIRAREGQAAGLFGAFAFPIMSSGKVIGVAEFFSDEIRSPNRELLDMLGSVGGLIGQFIERKRGEEALRESSGKLQEAMEQLKQSQQQIIQQERLHALGSMASGIAHDFNNALSPILGFSEILLARPENLTNIEKLKHSLESINTAAKDAGRVVSRLREFYRHREKSEVFHSVELGSVIVQVIELTKPKWKDLALASGTIITVKTELEETPVIQGSESELREMLTNLIFNAVDAMPRGGEITIRTREESGRIFLDVCDTGIGMTAEVRQKCLEPFFTTKGERGTGLGLPMVFGTINRHEGALEIASTPGKGTTFSITFPVRDEGETAAEAPSPRVRAQALRILIVEDEPAVRDMLQEYLAGDGHAVEEAVNGRQALEKFHASRFDLIITDRGMPEMSGDRLAAIIKQVAPTMPVILLTGFGDMMIAAGESPEGVDLILNKPITLNDLREGISKIIDSSGSHTRST